MEYPSEFNVQDVHGAVYTVSNEGAVRLNQRCTVLMGKGGNGMSVFVRLFDYDSDAEGERIRTMLAAHLKQQLPDSAESVLLNAPFAGYVTDAEGGRLLRNTAFRSLRANCQILAQVCFLLEQFEQKGYVLCGGAEDAFLYTASNKLKFCAPECLYQPGEPVFLEGPELRRPPEAFPPGYRIADAYESGYYAACLACRLLWGCSPFDKVLPEEMEEAEDGGDYELFEFGGDYEFEEPGLPRLFGSLELSEESAGTPSDTYLPEELEEKIAGGSLSWYLGVFSKKRGEQSALRRFACMSSMELVQLADRTFRTPFDRTSRPTLREWKQAALSVFESVVACPHCGMFFQPEVLCREEMTASEHKCVYSKCGAPLPKLYRLRIYERFTERVDEPQPDSEVKPKLARLLCTRYILEKDEMQHSVSGSLLFEDAYLSGHTLLRYRWYETDGRSGVLVQLKSFEEDPETAVTFRVNDTSAQMQTEQGYRSFLLVPSVTRCVSVYAQRNQTGKPYYRCMSVEVSEVKQQA